MKESKCTTRRKEQLFRMQCHRRLTREMIFCIDHGAVGLHVVSSLCMVNCNEKHYMDCGCFALILLDERISNFMLLSVCLV